MESELKTFARVVKAELSDLEDPRRGQGQRYKLPSLLLLLLIGFLRGMKTIKEVLEKSRHDEDLLSALNLKRVPAPGTYTNLFKQLPMESVNKVLKDVGMTLDWKSGQVAIDGKSVKGSVKDGLYLHILNASTEAGIPLLQKQSALAGGEIKSAETVLADLDLDGQIVTGDAMFAQRKLCRQLSKKNALALQAESQSA